jgi:hypothetical protein
MRNFLLWVAKALLVLVALPAAVIAGLVGSREKRDAKQVASYLSNFINGEGEAWDWDDFVSVPIADPALESIRQRAAAVELPTTDRGLSTLRQLLVEADRLAAGN